MSDGAEEAAERLAAIQRDAQLLAEQASGHAHVQRQAPLTNDLAPLMRVLSNITLGSFVLLALTGVHLFFYYRPLSRLSGESQLAGGTSGVGGLSELSRQLHVLAGWLVAIGVVVGLVVWVWPRRRPLVIAALPIAALFGLAAIVGSRAAWSAVQTTAASSSSPTGFVALFSDQVEAIARQGQTVSATNLLLWLVAHVGLGLVVVAAVVAVRRVAQVD